MGKCIFGISIFCVLYLSGRIFKTFQIFVLFFRGNCLRLIIWHVGPSTDGCILSLVQTLRSLTVSPHTRLLFFSHQTLPSLTRLLFSFSHLLISSLARLVLSSTAPLTSLQATPEATSINTLHCSILFVFPLFSFHSTEPVAGRK
jgi:hypothetical protein